MSDSLYERAEKHYGYHMRNIRKIEEEFEKRRELGKQPRWVRFIVILAISVFVFICAAACGLVAWEFFII